MNVKRKKSSNIKSIFFLLTLNFKRRLINLLKIGLIYIKFSKYLQQMLKYKTSKLIKSNRINNDSRGYFNSLLDDNIKNISYLFNKRNTIRSNHYHLKDYHYIFVISGNIHYFYKKINAKKISYIYVNKGETIFTPPLEIHATFFNRDSSMLVANNLPRKKNVYESDLVRNNFMDINLAKAFLKKI